jgi:hypothetical protein
VQPAAAAPTLPPPLQQPMLHLPMLLLPLLRQICCGFHNPRAQPNLQPLEMRPDPHEGMESARAKLFLNRQEPHTIYFLPKFMFTQKNKKIKLPFTQKNKIRLLFTTKLHAEQTACRTKYPCTIEVQQ